MRRILVVACLSACAPEGLPAATSPSATEDVTDVGGDRVLHPLGQVGGISGGCNCDGCPARQLLSGRIG